MFISVTFLLGGFLGLVCHAFRRFEAKNDPSGFSDGSSWYCVVLLRNYLLN